MFLELHDLRRGVGMPIDRLAKDGKINPEDVDRLNQAFARVLKVLGLVDRDDPFCQMIARKIVEVNATGIRDPEEIAGRVARSFGAT